MSNKDCHNFGGELSLPSVRYTPGRKLTKNHKTSKINTRLVGTQKLDQFVSTFNIGRRNSISRDPTDDNAGLATDDGDISNSEDETDISHQRPFSDPVPCSMSELGHDPAIRAIAAAYNLQAQVDSGEGSSLVSGATIREEEDRLDIPF